MASMPAITLNKETLGLVVACFSICGTVFGIYNWMLAGRAENSPVVKELIIKDQKQDQRLDRTDEDRVNNTEALKEQTAETQKLKEAVVKLTTVLEGSTVTKKAEYQYPSPLPGREPISLEIR